jgi:hypothetical protein
MDDEAPRSNVDLNEYAALIGRALFVAEDARLIDLCTSLDLTTAEGEQVRNEFIALHDALLTATAPAVDPNQLEIPGVA